MAGAALGQVGPRRPRAAGLESPRREAHFREDPAAQPVRLGAAPPHSGSAARRGGGEGAPLERSAELWWAVAVAGGGWRVVVGGKETGTGGPRRETWRRGQLWERHRTGWGTKKGVVSLWRLRDRPPVLNRGGGGLQAQRASSGLDWELDSRPFFLGTEG